MIDWDTSQSLVARDRNRLRQVHQKKKDVELLMTTVRGLRISPFLKLEDNCFTMLHQFLLYNTVNQLHVYVCTPSHLDLPRILFHPTL